MASRAAVRYAKAVLELAKDQKAAEAVNDDMQQIADTISKNKDLYEMLQNPVVRSSVKKKVLSEVFVKSNNITQGLFDTLISNKRVSILADIAVRYNQLYDEFIGTEVAQVTTAVPLTKELENKVQAKVKELIGKEAAIKNIVDESILGGFILRIGDTQYNASVVNKLNKLKREFELN